MRLRLFVPAPFDTLTGGYAYDRAIVAGLRALGHTIDVTELAGRHPLPDDAARAAADAAWKNAPHDLLPVIDGLGLPAFAPLADALAARGTVALIHHPTALETGRDDVSREQLRALELALLPRFARVIVTSEDTARRLAAEFGVAGERIRVVEPGTPDLPRSEGPAREPGCCVLCIGSLLPRKGHDVLLRALARLPDLDWSLTIVGGARDLEYAASLHALAIELGVATRTAFKGELGPAALQSLWDEAGVFALATHYEGYGMAIAEAFRRGVPVAVTADAGLAARVPAAAGVVAEPGDYVALSNALRRLVFDADLRRTMAEAAWAHGRSLPDWSAQAALFAASVAP